MHIIEPPSPGVARAVGARRTAIAAVTALACAAMIGACGSSSSSTSSTAAKTNLNTAHVAASIEQSILSERHIHAKVSCPAVVPQQQGKTFVCIATTSKGKTPFEVTVQNSKGYVTYAGK
jgi:Domain of unknown function (DUF4333)